MKMKIYGVHIIGSDKILSLVWSKKEAMTFARYFANTYYPGELTENDFDAEVFYVDYPPELDESEPLNLATLKLVNVRVVQDHIDQVVATTGD